jgi:hypothetical protein
MIDRELNHFAHLVLRLRDAAAWGSESDLVVKSMKVAKAIAELDALRAETTHESPWRLARRRALEKAVEAVIPVQAITWGSWLQTSPGAVLEPIIKVSGMPLPVIALLVAPRCASKKELKGLELLRRVTC